MTTLLKIGALSIPNRAALDLDQTYESIGGETLLRTVSGAGIKQETWRRLRTTLSGGGWLPAGLETIDTSITQTIACIVPRALIADASRQATLPVGRRADAGHQPFALALLDFGDVVPTPLAIAGNLATADAVAGAIGYQILYFPLLTCWVQRPSESGSRGEASYRWELVAEEV
jgi:hypothetical protein